MTVLDRVHEPSPVPHDQPGILANATTTTDTIPGQWTRGLEDVMIDETGESSASRRALRLHLQLFLSTIALLSSFEAATACGAGPQERAETPLSAFGPTIQEQRTQSSEAPFMSPTWMHMFLRTAPQSCVFQTCFALRTTIATIFLASN